MHGQSPGREAGPQGDRQFAAGADVQAKSGVVHPPGHRGAQERLAGVEDVAAGERFGVRPGAGADVTLVQQHERGAVPRGQVSYGEPAEVQYPVDPFSRLRPDGRIDPVDVLGRRRRRRLGQHVGVPRPGRMGRSAHDIARSLMPGYIRSGALTPSRPRPLASTTRVASHSHSRASVSAPGTSSPCGSTRQES